MAGRVILYSTLMVGVVSAHASAFFLPPPHPVLFHAPLHIAPIFHVFPLPPPLKKAAPQPRAKPLSRPFTLADAELKVPEPFPMPGRIPGGDLFLDNSLDRFIINGGNTVGGSIAVATATNNVNSLNLVGPAQPLAVGPGLGLGGLGGLGGVGGVGGIGGLGGLGGVGGVGGPGGLGGLGGLGGVGGVGGLGGLGDLGGVDDVGGLGGLGDLGGVGGVGGAGGIGGVGGVGGIGGPAIGMDNGGGDNGFKDSGLDYIDSGYIDPYDASFADVGFGQDSSKTSLNSHVGGEISDSTVIVHSTNSGSGSNGGYGSNGHTKSQFSAGLNGEISDSTVIIKNAGNGGLGNLGSLRSAV